jgi:tripartite-type tricarboxylate transporter receptor subunit TctC
MHRRNFAGLLAAGALALPGIARAAWPERPVTVIVPYPPGGNNDILARLLGPVVEREIGQPLVIDNRGGGGGTIGAGLAARAPADGHTVLFADIGILAIAPHLFAQLPFGPDAFAPIVRLTEVSLIAAVPNNSPNRSMADLLAAARARPEALNFGSPGPGTAGHLATQMLMGEAGIRMTHVPFRGSAPAAQELVAGRIDLLLDGTLLPLVQQGQVRALAVTGARRNPYTPELPTIAEAGVPGYAFASWHGVVAPRGAPAEAIARLNAAYNRAVQDAAVLDRAKQLGLPLVGGTPQDFANWIVAERDKFGPVVRASGARVE